MSVPEDYYGIENTFGITFYIFADVFTSSKRIIKSNPS